MMGKKMSEHHISKTNPKQCFISLVNIQKGKSNYSTVRFALKFSYNKTDKGT